MAGCKSDPPLVHEHGSRLEQSCLLLSFQHLLDITSGIEFFLCRTSRHVADLAEDRPVEPGAVVFATDGPRYPGIAIWITTIEFVFVIQGDGKIECSSR